MRDEPRPGVRTAGMLLTGGRSRRMGFDKALAVIDGEVSARRCARILGKVVSPVIEIGAGCSGLRHVREEPVGSGPLVAMSCGAQTLWKEGHRGPFLVLACDLPLVTEAALRMLAEWPTECSVVPVVDGWPQPLCARWSAPDLEVATELVGAGERSAKALLSRCEVVLLDVTAGTAGVEPRAFADVDTPAELDQLGLSWRPGAFDAR